MYTPLVLLSQAAPDLRELTFVPAVGPRSYLVAEGRTQRAKTAQAHASCEWNEAHMGLNSGPRCWTWRRKASTAIRRAGGTSYRFQRSSREKNERKYRKIIKIEVSTF